MRRSLIAGAILALACVAAQAADLPAFPTKAAPANKLDFLHPYTGSGFYIGGYTLGGGGSADGNVPGANPASITVLQGSLGILAGYAWSNSDQSVFLAVEGMVGWTNLNGQQNGLSFNGPIQAEQRFLIGTPLSNISQYLPGWPNVTPPPLPSLPPGVTAGNVHPYFMVSLHEDAVGLNFGQQSNQVWAIAPGVGVGALTQLSNGLAWDVWFETRFGSKGFCTGINQDACANLGQSYLAGAALKF